MSFTGRIEVQCPQGCEPFEAEVWSFVRGDEEGTLRDTFLAGELNFLSCETCGALFRPETSVIYFDPGAVLAAFVLPESWRGEEAKWRAKMAEDFEAMRLALGEDMPVGEEPLVFFGFEPLIALLGQEDDLADEVAVAEHLSGELGLSLRPVDRSFARRHGLPWKAPGAKGSGPVRERVLTGLDALLKANGRLSGYVRWREHLRSGGEAPFR